eukprot:2336828-Amphidinium_carterae.2
MEQCGEVHCTLTMQPKEVHGRLHPQVLQRRAFVSASRGPVRTARRSGTGAGLDRALLRSRASARSLSRSHGSRTPHSEFNQVCLSCMRMMTLARSPPSGISC